MLLTMHIRPIHTPADYQSTLKEVCALFDADPPRGTPDADRLGILDTLLKAYETHHYALELRAR